MPLLRVRITSFLAGFATAAGLSFGLLAEDLKQSHRLLSAQAEGYDKGLEKRVSTLEAALKQLKGGKN